jgi:tetratricopeptide (TPR) repeat protein
VFFNQGEYLKALEYTKKFLHSAQSLGDKRNLGVAYGVLGNVYRQQNRLDEAMDAYRRQLEIMSELGDIRSKTYALGNIGRVYRLKYDYPMAMEYYRRHLALAEELGDKRSISFAEGALGGAYKELLAFPKSRAHYQRAIALCRELKLTPELADNLVQAAELMLLQGDAGQARSLDDEAMILAAGIEQQGTLFTGRLLQSRITARDDAAAAATMMRALLGGELSDQQRAEVCYRLFQLTGDEDCRQQALEAFQSAYDMVPDPALKLRLEELS